MLATVASDSIIDSSAYRWLCHQRRGWPSDSDVWDLRFHWINVKRAIQKSLLRGDYCFAPMSRVTKADGQIVHVWSSRDALVLKALAIVLAERLPVSVHCIHLKGHGGTKAAVRSVRGRLALHQIMLKTDVKSYYESIDQRRLLEMLALHVRDRNVLNLLWQAMRRTVTWGGLYRECEQGISPGCPLSPLLGAVFLGALDAAMEKLGMFYVRFMDDVLVLTDTRWQLRKAVKVLNGVLSSLGLDKAPDKTFIGRIEKGFDFLGHHFSRAALTAAAKSVSKLNTHAVRPYEQERGGIGTYRPPVLGHMCGGGSAWDRRATTCRG